MFTREEPTNRWTVSAPRDTDELAADRHADEVLRRLGDASVAPSPSVPEPFARAFGRDFSGVRLHTDSAAAQVARAFGAHAVTVGRQILFGAGAYRPDTPGGRRLLAHELAHVVQHESDPRPRVRRLGYGCPDLVALAGAVSVLSGPAVHQLIQGDFASVAGARSVAIPGASASPQRTEGICGGFSKVIPPQILGGQAGLGFPDLAAQRGSRLSVAEIKPAAPECLVDGEVQLARYVEQGNADDPQQVAWRRGEGISRVVPMTSAIYRPKDIAVPPVVIKTGWCLPGLLGYAVITPPPVRVTAEERADEKRKLEEEARRRRLAVGVAAAATVTVAVAGRALWRHFWRVVAERFAVRAAAALFLAAADGPLPFGELIDAGLAVVTVIQIGIEWNELWRKADELAATGA
ncbi:DUF4157 domain-containing protein [Nonomuraea wenchangensis]